MNSLQDIWAAPPTWDGADPAAPLPPASPSCFAGTSGAWADPAVCGCPTATAPASSPPLKHPAGAGPATPAGAFCALRRGGGASSSLGGPGESGGGGEMTPGGVFLAAGCGGSPIKAGAASRARAGPPAVSLVAGCQYALPLAPPAFAAAPAPPAPVASPLSARSVLAVGAGGPPPAAAATAGADWVVTPDDAPSPSSSQDGAAAAAAAAADADPTAVRVAAAAAALAARLGAGVGQAGEVDFATLYALVGSLFDEACVGVDHAAVLQELAPLNRAACVACLRCVAEFLRCPESLAAVERDLAAAAAADAAAGRERWGAP